MKLYATQNYVDNTLKNYVNNTLQNYSNVLKKKFDINAQLQIVDTYSEITDNLTEYFQDILFYLTTDDIDPDDNITVLNAKGFYYFSIDSGAITPFNMGTNGNSVYIQSTAPTDINGLWIDTSNADTIDMKLYDSLLADWASLNSINYSNVIIISKEDYDAIPEEERKQGYYYLVYNDDSVIDDLTGGIIIYEFDETDLTKSYVKGSYVIHNTSIYRCIAETGSTAGVFDETEWEAIGGTLASSEGIAIKEFDTTVEYQADEYVIYNNTIYKANTETTTGSFIESEWDLIGGESGTSNKSNVIAISNENYEALPEEDKNNPDYFYLIYDADGNVSVNGSSNVIKIKEFDSTKSYTVDECVIYDNKLYIANTTTTIGSFIESEWNLISGTKNKSNVIVMSEDEYNALSEDEKNSDEYYHLVYDADGNISIDSSSNAIKIKDFNSTISYVADECVIYNNKLYRANTTTSTGSFVENEWKLIATDNSNILEAIGDLEMLPDGISKTSLVDAITQVFQHVDNVKVNMASAITDKGVATSQTDSFATMIENIRLITLGESLDSIHNAMNNLGYTDSALYDYNNEETAQIISEWFILKTATENSYVVLDAASDGVSFTNWLADSEITDFGNYINPTYSATQLTVSEDTTSGLFVSEELVVHELCTINYK